MENGQSLSPDETVSQQALETQSQVSQPNNVKGIVLVIACLMILGVVGGSGYYLGLRHTSGSETTTKPGVSPIPEVVNNQSNSEVESSDLQTYTQKKVISVNQTGTFENALIDVYNISYPQDWKAVSDLATLIPASATSKTVYIFRPGDNPDEGFFRGIVIEDVGENPTISTEQLCKIGTQGNVEIEEVVINGTKMLSGGNTHGRVYCANIPDTGSYLSISGFGLSENLASPEVIEDYMAVLNSFKFASVAQ
ncbi:MAG: hypothetical protein COU66_00475 [Candidatus Pacebacteria bacterium CG10_big_fil_rev_8_21_14_0_10_44_11]|nr:MAG: hypothetical protein COU66_00475 [Candidatus Pacebacteria bacterium CG10_big_fil_rev_8_21_14_0_10_44_11]